MVLNDSLFSSKHMDWETPDVLFFRLNEEFQFTLDPCASFNNSKCEKFFTKEDDGLIQKWEGRVFCNPPYGRGIGMWVEKAYRESRINASVVVCLLPVRSDTKWWHNWVMKSSQIRLLNRRLTFKGSNNKSPVPSAIVVFSREIKNKPELVSYDIQA